MKYKAEILQELKKQAPQAKLPRYMELIPANIQNCVSMRLPLRAAMAANMQEDISAFESWALLLHIHCGLCLRLELDQSLPCDSVCRGHYGRFLYRASRFSKQFGDWFFLSDNIKSHTDQFQHYLLNHQFCNNPPTKEAATGSQSENQVEAEFADTSHGKKLLSELSRQAGILISQDSIHRQLPVGLFQGKKSKAASVFTGKKSAVDLWAISGNQLVIYELKRENQMVGILTELMFYANYMYDMYVERRYFAPSVPGKSTWRGYSSLYQGQFTGIQAAMLTDTLHPLITPDVIALMNQGDPHICYHDLRYRLKDLSFSASNGKVSL